MYTENVERKGGSAKEHDGIRTDEDVHVPRGTAPGL